MDLLKNFTRHFREKNGTMLLKLFHVTKRREHFDSILWNQYYPDSKTDDLKAKGKNWQINVMNEKNLIKFLQTEFNNT